MPRHLFLPDVPLETVYTDEAVPTRKCEGLAISSSSQPAVMAIMLEQLDLQPGDRVLEIGAGTGYNAALMAHLVGPTGSVVTIDIDQDIVEDARAHLTTADLPRVEVLCRDGALGYPERASYDRIILTVGAWDIAPAWIEQLRPGGRLVLPLALNGTVQKLVAFQQQDGSLASVSVRDGAFMPLRGIRAGPQTNFALGPQKRLVLGLGEPRSVDPDHVYRLLTGPYDDIPIPLPLTPDDLWTGVSLWLALRAPTMCSLATTGESAAAQLVPSPLSTSPTYRATIGLLEEASLCLLAPVPDEAPPSEETPFSLAVRRFGQRDGSAERLIDLLRAWDDAGRPSTPSLRITAYPRGARLTATPNQVIISKPATQLVLSW